MKRPIAKNCGTFTTKAGTLYHVVIDANSEVWVRKEGETSWSGHGPRYATSKEDGLELGKDMVRTVLGEE